MAEPFSIKYLNAGNLRYYFSQVFFGISLAVYISDNTTVLVLVPSKVAENNHFSPHHVASI